MSLIIEKTAQIQFGLCTSDLNFWEEHREDEPEDGKLAIDRQR